MRVLNARGAATQALDSLLTLSEEEIINYFAYVVVILDFPLCAPNLALTSRELRLLLTIQIL